MFTKREVLSFILGVVVGVVLAMPAAARAYSALNGTATLTSGNVQVGDVLQLQVVDILQDAATDPVPPTATGIAPTATLVPPTATSVPPTATATDSAAAKPAPTATKPAPTATKPAPTATAVPPTATPAKQTWTLQVSKANNRTNPLDLAGQTVSGNIYIFAVPGSGAQSVKFALDSTTAFRQTEANPPYDFAGGSAATANAFDTTTAANGQHYIYISVVRTDGSVFTSRTDFNVSNPVVAPAQPTATPAQPTPVPQTSGAIYWGISASHVPWDVTATQAWERDVAGKSMSIQHWGVKWDNNGGYRAWENSQPDKARQMGAIPMISWTPEGGDASRWQLQDIINGQHDAYIRDWARGAKAWGKPFFLRIMHEMNRNFNFPWQEGENGNQKGQFVPAWKRIVDILRAEGLGGQASLVWCPNVDWPGNTDASSFASVYPGDDYVDWTCLDGYNWGSVNGQASGWESFDQVFSYSYNEVLKIAPSKPMMLGEFGSNSAPGSKPDWFTDALTVQLPQRYQRVRAAVYYNRVADGSNWLIEENAQTQAAWKTGIASPYYLPANYGNLSGAIPVP